jgi:hypothetical protein
MARMIGSLTPNPLRVVPGSSPPGGAGIFPAASLSISRPRKSSILSNTE